MSENEEIVQNYLENNKHEIINTFLEVDEDESKKNPICKVHKIQMELKKIKIIYGLTNGPITGYSEEKEKSFPNCDDEKLGGCCVSDDSPKTKIKYVCNICNQKREEWKVQHRSIISLWLNMNINKNFIMCINNEIKLLIRVCL